MSKRCLLPLIAAAGPGVLMLQGGLPGRRLCGWPTGPTRSPADRGGSACPDGSCTTLAAGAEGLVLRTGTGAADAPAPMESDCGQQVALRRWLAGRFQVRN